MIKNNLGSTAVPGYNEASGIPKLIIRNNLRALGTPPIIVRKQIPVFRASK